jgi:hypothetical protein
MTMYEIEFIRRVPGRDEPQIIDTYNMTAERIGEVIHRAGLALHAGRFRVRPETFRIRESNGSVVY